MKTVKTSLAEKEYDVFAWTDSTVVLGWLHGDITRWKQFVANRVQQITEIIPISHWSHVRSEDNPADCATRGLTLAKLQNHVLWWKGPERLSNFDPDLIKNNKYEITILESKKVCVNTALQLNYPTLINELLNNNSSITRAVKTLAWVSRFIAALRNQLTEHDTILSQLEINKAYYIIIKNIQSEDFESDLEYIIRKGHVRPSSKLAALFPYLDKDGILRVGGRLSNSNISTAAKHPIILSKSSRFTELIINQAHVMILHGRPQLTLSYIREKYWILSGMSTVKRQLRRCVTCRRFSTENQQQIMADLPRARVTPSRPFSHTGVDFTGHIDLKASKGRGVRTHKGYVAVFVCLATKAVHLELVSDLSTPAFLAAFHRFCARRGTPRRMYSDNGTNFIGAKRVLDKEYRQIVQNINHEVISNVRDMDIEWSFNAPAWPSAGGLWESAVRSFKRHLKRVLGEQKLTYEEFTTLLYQIEACLNSRPLFRLTENPENNYLTPGHFLIGDSLLSRPQSDPDDLNLPERWRLVQAMNKRFWNLWSTDYLHQLQIRAKWRVPTRNMNVNDIVLIKEDNLPPGKWALGKIIELHPGKDGHVRVVTIKTKGTMIKRPIIKLILLPIETSSNETSLSKQSHQHTPVNSTRTRTKSRNISKASFTLAILLITFFLPSTTQQKTSFNTTSFTATSFNDSKSLYFDKISNLQYIRDEWKLVVYYNLTSYWNSIIDMENYITHLKSISKRANTQYIALTDQLQHEISEIEHNNKLLQGFGTRRLKRGLINGVGTVANYLFGVLDDNFARQYAKDIEKLTYNDDHFMKLLKNQTLIVESEYNVIKRNEQIINQQLNTFYNRLINMSSNVNQIRAHVDIGLYIMSSTLEASVILENIRRMQDVLMDLVTDIHSGHINTHLLTVEQLEEQINFISGRIQGDLKVPIQSGKIQNLYKLLKVSAKIQKKFLIIEIKVPLVTNEIYELDKIISIPHNIGEKSYLTVPLFPYIAYNPRKDLVTFLTDQDLQNCLQASEETIICSVDKPTYEFKYLTSTICNLNLINTERSTTACTYEIYRV